MLGDYTNSRDMSLVSDMNAKHYTNIRAMPYVSNMNARRLY